SVFRDDDGIRLRLAANHFYEAGEYRVRKQAEKELADVAKVIKELGRKVTVEGHTDSTVPSGTIGNWELSGLRAGYMMRHFINNHGIAPSQLMLAGYADTKPIAHNTTAE